MIAGDEGMLLLDRSLDSFNLQDAIDQSRLLEWVRGEIGKMAPRYRSVLVLRYLEEKNYKEIAEILQIPMGTVATLINRGQKRLKREFEKILIELEC